MNTKALLVLLLTLLWFWFCHWWYTCLLYQECYDCGSNTVVEQKQEVTPPPAAATVAVGTLVFNWDSAEPITNEKFPALKQQWVNGLSDGQNFEITGYYYPDEKNTTRYENLGLARAHRVKELFLKDIPDNRIVLRSQMLEGEPKSKSLFESCNFQYVQAPNLKEVQENPVVELADRIVIYFPTNSSQKNSNNKVDDYLSKLAERLKQTNEKVIITGHTDNVGSPEANQALAQKRADAIKSIIVRKGIAANRITALSKGETEPTASNDTAEGRQLNRRCELQIVK
ncbi:MAG: OmpA family protein [Chitinophagales bacterium]|nr:OmpA family protein [Bacteroidota bacterium]MCB9044452.1 OmpA family protein [Chitinophagales bacterium]